MCQNEKCADYVILDLMADRNERCETAKGLKTQGRDVALYSSQLIRTSGRGGRLRKPAPLMDAVKKSLAAT